MGKIFSPYQVIPPPLSKAVNEIDYWFVIGGQAVRCFCPYRPSCDVDFGVGNVKNLEGLISTLEKQGEVEILERGSHTVHLQFNGINVSIFVLEKLLPFVENRCLTITAILATKLHAIMDRGKRRDFFDLYITLQTQRLGIAECLASMRKVYDEPIHDSLLLRALTYFSDAEDENPLPNEGPNDWKVVKDYFLTQVGSLLTPPIKELSIQKKVIDIVQDKI